MLGVGGEDVALLLGGGFVGLREGGDFVGGQGLGELDAEEVGPVEVVVGVDGLGGRARAVVAAPAGRGGEDRVGKGDLLEGEVRGVFEVGGDFVCSDFFFFFLVLVGGLEVSICIYLDGFSMRAFCRRTSLRCRLQIG